MSIGEWTERMLCPDGGCVGVIGAEGTCKVCGRVAPNWGEERTRGLSEAEPDADADDAPDDDDDDDDDPTGDAVRAGGYGSAPVGAIDVADLLPGAQAALGDAREWLDRKLCPDGACLGVLGPDGRCSVCARTEREAADGEPAEDA